MAVFDLKSDNEASGGGLKNQAANFLAELYGPGRTEERVSGKKADAYFVDERLGKKQKIYLEAKDFGSSLSRQDVVNIWSDYSGIVTANQPATLLLVTRNGLSSDAQSFVQIEQPFMAHRTIWELEDEILGLIPYVRRLEKIFHDDGLSSFYVPAHVSRISFDEHNKQILSSQHLVLFDEISQWMNSGDGTPIAILGGYGAGKTSFTEFFLSNQAEKALSNPAARRPILIKLGMISRYNSLDGLLGAMFTSDHSIKGYSFQRFMNFNSRGRLVVVLDGFDEMKHAMSWVDFRNQVRELNRLVQHHSKILILGRPTAFTSDAEHDWILRGRKEFAGGHRRLPDWPEFREYQLEGFTLQERREFVERFLTYRERVSAINGDRPIDEVWVERRSEEVNRLADLDQEMFTRPVHAKILTDLAADKSVNLSIFDGNVTRWTLYDEFFKSLAARECEKPARSPIGEGNRLTFLRELAFWLWTAKGSATSFHASDIPEVLLDGLPDGDCEEFEEKCREYLAGAFLERKAGDLFFFPHRSFAEFLVAQRMYFNPPGPADHENYGNVVREGVVDFLKDVPDQSKVADWVATLPFAKGTLNVEYLTFLADYVGGASALAERIPDDCSYKKPFALMDRQRLQSNAIVMDVRNTVLESDPLGMAIVALFVGPLGAFSSSMLGKEIAIAETMAASLLERFFGCVREEPGAQRFSVVAGLNNEIKELTIAGVQGIFSGKNGRVIRFSWQKLTQRATRMAKENGVGFNYFVDTGYALSRSNDYELPLANVLARMTPAMQKRVGEYVRPIRGAISVFSLFR